MDVATFGAGCFWGVESTFRAVRGVADTTVGYSGGTMDKPTYHDVCAGGTGHTEVVRVEYDPERVSYESLLDVFWSCHDPTQRDRQGPDIGYQYRSVIFFHTPEQRVTAEVSLSRLQEQERFSRPIATAIEPATAFWRAEEYHQRYLEKKGTGGCRRPRGN